MTQDSRLTRLESAVGSGDGPTLCRLLGISVLGQPPIEPYSDEEILSLAHNAEFQRMARALLGSEVDDLTAEEMAAEFISWKREGVAAWQYRHGILQTDPAGWQRGATAAAVAVDRPDGPQDARGGDDRPDGRNIDPAARRGREGQN